MTNPNHPDVRALLGVVLEAIDLPFPATIGDREVRDRLLAERAMLAVTVARAALAENPANIDWNVDYLRTQLAEHPATGYQAHGETEAGR